MLLSGNFAFYWIFPTVGRCMWDVLEINYRQGPLKLYGFLFWRSTSPLMRLDFSWCSQQRGRLWWMGPLSDRERENEKERETSVILLLWGVFNKKIGFWCWLARVAKILKTLETLVLHLQMLDSCIISGSRDLSPTICFCCLSFYMHRFIDIQIYAYRV